MSIFQTGRPLNMSDVGMITPSTRQSFVKLKSEQVGNY